MKLRYTSVIYCLLIALIAALPTWNSLPAHSQDPTTQVIESDEPAVIRIGNWTSQTALQASGSSYLYSSGTDSDVLTLQFSGPSIEVIFVTGPSLGTLVINVDDIVLRTVITTAETTAYRQSSRIDYLSDEPHTLKVYAQAGGVIGVDAFLIPGLPASPSTEGNLSGLSARAVCDGSTVVRRASISTGGQQADQNSFHSAISSDGRYVAFESNATNLVAGDTNNRMDIFVHDRLTCDTTLVSQSTASNIGNENAFFPSISNDGRYVAFQSEATNLIPSDGNGFEDIFVRDRQNNTTVRVSVAIGGGDANGRSGMASISGDGRYVVFQSLASDLVANDNNNMQDIFMYDLQTATTTRLSVDSSGNEGDAASSAPTISNDGNFVVYESLAAILVANDSNGLQDIFVRDIVNNTTSRVSVATGGTEATGGASDEPSISGDGRYVTFYSAATNLVANDTNAALDVFVHDLQSTTTTRVSVDSSGNQASAGPNFARPPGISSDGRYIVFESSSTTLISVDTNAAADIFRHDRTSGLTIRISISLNAAQSNAASSHPVISANGGYYAYASLASNLVTSDGNNMSDIFVMDLGDFSTAPTNLQVTALSNSQISMFWGDISSETGYRIERSPNGTTDWVEIGSVGVNVVGYRNISLNCGTAYHYRVRGYRVLDGSFSGYSNVATTTTSACTTCVADYRTQIISKENVLAGVGHSREVQVGQDGRYVVFTSAANNIVAGDLNGHDDIFLYDRQTCQYWLISQTTQGVQSVYHSAQPVVSNDGRYVVFTTTGNDLVSNDTVICLSLMQSCRDIYLHDRTLGQTRMISVSPTGQPANENSGDPAISADGRYVVFWTSANNLVPGFNSLSDIVLYEIQTGQTSIVSLSSTNQDITSIGIQPSISADGRFVAFRSQTSNLVPNDTNGSADIFVRDRQLNTTTLISVSSTGTQGNLDSNWPEISGDGRYISFTSSASNLVTGDTNSRDDVFVHDRQTTQTTRVSVSSSGAQSDSYSTISDISDDGRYVVFASQAATLVPEDTSSVFDIYLHDRVTAETSLVSKGLAGDDSLLDSIDPVVSGNGRFILFSSLSNHMVTDVNGVEDIYFVMLPNDTLTLFRTSTNATSKISTLRDLPPAGAYNTFTNTPPAGATGGQWVMGDWDGDGQKTPGAYASNGVFYYTNIVGPTSNWNGIWFGLFGRPAVAGRFDATRGNDCIGVVDSGNFPPFGIAFAMYFTCDMSGGNPPKSFQWLSVVLADTAGFAGLGDHQFAAGDYNRDGVDSIAIRRGPFIAYTQVSPAPNAPGFGYSLSTFIDAQYIGAPSSNDYGIFVVGDWDHNDIDSFGLFYQDGYFYRRNDLQWNSGQYTLQRVGQPIGTPMTATSWH